MLTGEMVLENSMVVMSVRRLVKKTYNTGGKVKSLTAMAMTVTGRVRRISPSTLVEQIFKVSFTRRTFQFASLGSLHLDLMLESAETRSLFCFFLGAHSVCY